MSPIARDRVRTVFLLDVDNTLLDNDAVVADLRAELTREVGAERELRYWSIFEQRRGELGYADYLGTLQQFRAEYPHDASVAAVSKFLVNYPFRERLFPGAVDVVRYLAQWGTPVILTDGDIVFQPLKIERSGLWAAVEGRVLLYVHKEKELAEVARLYPAGHYVLIDDKVRILSAVKNAWGARVTTVFPKQGHYATDAAIAGYPAPDVEVGHIADLLGVTPPPGTDKSRTAS
jgi:FMN phosphatase YigB (HAD superfamily)